MKVENMTSAKGNKLANQFIISEELPTKTIEYFQSYDSIIVKRTKVVMVWRVYLDKKYWNYSRTTAKYRRQFLGETKAETQKKIDSGEYKLVNLN